MERSAEGRGGMSDREMSRSVSREYGADRDLRGGDAGLGASERDRARHDGSADQRL